MAPTALTGKTRRKSSSDRTSVGHSRILALAAISLLCFIASGRSAKFAFVPTAIAQEEPKATPLVPGGVVSQEIEPGASQAYEVTLKQGQYLGLTVRKGDLHVLVTIQSPAGEKSATFMSRRYGPLEILQIAKTSGSYLVSVESLEKESAQNVYAISLRDPGDSTPVDRISEAAIAASNAAEIYRAEWKEQSLKDAIGKYLEAASQWKSIGRHQEAAQALENIGDVYSMMSTYELALESYEKALASRRAAGDRVGEIDALNGIAYARINLGDDEKAPELLNQALNSLEAAGSGPENKRRMAKTLNNFGEAYYAVSDLQKSLDYFNRALALWIDAGDRFGQAMAHLNLGYCFYETGDIQKAATHYQQALALRIAIDDRRGGALARTALGGVYSFLGEHQLALDSHNEAMKQLRDIGDHLGEGAALNGIGRAYEDLNENQIALDSYIRARDAFQQVRKSDYEALTYYYIGRVYRALEDRPAALKFYNQCISLSRKVENRRFEAYALKDIGIIYNSLGLRQKALAVFTQVLKYYRTTEDKRGEAYTLSSIGYTWYLSGKPATAVQYFEQALPLSRAIMDRPAEVSFLYNIALAERAQSEPEKALVHIKQSTEIIESMRTKVVSRDVRASYFASLHQHYELYVDLLMQLDKLKPNNGFKGAAFEISERARARSLLDSLTEVKVELTTTSELSLSERLGQLQRSLNAKAEYQMRLLNGKPSPEMTAQTDKDIRELRTEYDLTEAQLKAQSKRYAALSAARALRLEDVRSQIADGKTLLLEFALGEERSYLWTVSATSINGYELPNRKTLEEAARRTYELLIARQPLPDETASQYQERVQLADGLYWEQAALLSRLLLGPVKDQLSGKRLLIVADGALHYVPFDALPAPVATSDENSRRLELNADLSTTPLAADHEIVNLPSASVLAAIRQEDAPAAAKTIAILADPVFARDDPRVAIALQASAPAGNSGVDGQSAIKNVAHSSRDELYINRLPSALREAQMIAKLVSPSEANLLTGFDANHDAALSSELSHYRIIHFATHGIIDPEHPELSGIVLSLVDRQGNRQDGFLRLHEIYHLRLPADLVVLSACQTAIGKSVKGEGLIGLTRGFMFAGSKSVLATLWKVDDEATSELMAHFYKALLKDHLPPGVALQHAKVALRKQKRWQSPYFWAAFQLQGEYAKPIGPPAGWNSQIYLIGLALMAICLASGYYLYRYVRTSRAS